VCSESSGMSSEQSTSCRHDVIQFEPHFPEPKSRKVR
jgi:hypothetical protein